MTNMIEAPTRALREGSPGLLREGLVQLLRGYGRQSPTDGRDLAWSLAPYHDCALRLGLDPIALFGEVAAAAPPGLQDDVRAFGHRPATSPESFAGFALVDAPDGPTYVWT